MLLALTSPRSSFSLALMAVNGTLRLAEYISSSPLSSSQLCSSRAAVRVAMETGASGLSRMTNRRACSRMSLALKLLPANKRSSQMSVCGAFDGGHSAATTMW